MLARRFVSVIRLVFSVGAALTLAVASIDRAESQETFPSKPIRILVGFAAGGGNDLLARIVAQKLSENIGQPADGYTVLVGATGQLAVSSAIYPNLPFHPTKTLKPLIMLASYPLIIAAPATDNIKSVQELVAWAKANPQQSNYASSSPAFTIPTELFKLKTGMPAQQIPYKSTNEMALSVVAGQTLFTIADPSAVVPLAQSGKIRALAVAGATRLAALPDVPTMAEVGLADVDIRPQWSGAFVVAGTPPAIAAKLEAELRRALADAGVRDKIRAITYEPGGGTGEEFARRIDGDIRIFSDVVRAANLKFE